MPSSRGSRSLSREDGSLLSLMDCTAGVGTGVEEGDECGLALPDFARCLASLLCRHSPVDKILDGGAVLMMKMKVRTLRNTISWQNQIYKERRGQEQISQHISCHE